MTQDDEDTKPWEQWKQDNEDTDASEQQKSEDGDDGSSWKSSLKSHLWRYSGGYFILFCLIFVAIFAVAGGGEVGTGGGESLQAPADEHLTEEEAAEYVTTWVSRNVAEKDQTAFNHYEEGVEAIERDKYSRAVFELENSQKRYEDLKDRLFEKRNQYDEDQNRYQLFHLAWRMYFLRHEGTSSRYLQAFNAPDNPAEAARWGRRADEHYTEASRVATEYHNTIDEWQGEDE